MLLQQELSGHAADVKACVVLGNGDVATSSRDGTVRVWDLESGVSRVLTAHVKEGAINFVNALAVAPLNHPEKVLMASGSYDGTICEWNLTDDLAAPHRSFAGHSDAPKKEMTNVSCLAYRNDGLLLSGGWDGQVRVWEGGELRTKISAHSEAVWCLLPSAQNPNQVGSTPSSFSGQLISRPHPTLIPNTGDFGRC